MINQSIYDFKNDFNVGTVYFVPFLTEPNPQAMPNPNAPLPTIPTDSPSPSPTIPEITPAVAALTVALVSFVFVVAFKKNSGFHKNSHRFGTNRTDAQQVETNKDCVIFISKSTCN